VLAGIACLLPRAETSPPAPIGFAKLSIGLYKALLLIIALAALAVHAMAR
jgi:hypothetical protein